MKTELLLNNPSLISWSLDDIQGVRKSYKKQLKEFYSLMERLGIDLNQELEFEQESTMPLGRSQLVSKALYDQKRIHSHLRVLKREIERRRGLVGGTA